MDKLSPIGEYHLQGMREMASAFLLKAGGEFEFYFSYGALDRFGKGKWELKDDHLFFNSAPKPASDFTLIESNKSAENFINIKIKEGNPVLLHNVFCSLDNGGTWEQMSQYGDVQFPMQEIKSISLILEFCGERFSTIPVTTKDHNEFVFQFEPSIMEVFFSDFSLSVIGEGLIGGHPLIKGEEFNYAK